MNREKEEFFIFFKRVKIKENHLLNSFELPWFIYVQLKRKKNKGKKGRKLKGKRINQGRRKKRSVNN
jgi:hypothetical protein